MRALALLASLLVGLPALAQDRGPSASVWFTRSNTSAPFLTLTAPQGSASASCLVSGGTGLNGVCLGGYPGADKNALYLAISPSARTVNNFTLLTDQFNTVLNTPVTTVFTVGNAAQWTMNGSSLFPNTDNAEVFGASDKAPSTSYVRILRSRDNTQLQLISNIDDTTATASVPGVKIQCVQDLTSGDLCVDVQNSAATSLFKVTDDGATTIAGSIASGSALTKGAGIALVAGTKAITVLSGAACTCTSATTNAVRCSVSGTTLTVNGTGTDAFSYVCL